MKKIKLFISLLLALMSLSEVAEAQNNICSHATNISTSPFNVINQTAPPHTESWYFFKIPASVKGITVTNHIDEKINRITLYSGDCNSLVPVADTISSGVDTLTLNYAAQAGTGYFIRLTSPVCDKCGNVNFDVQVDPDYGTEAHDNTGLLQISCQYPNGDCSLLVCPDNNPYSFNLSNVINPSLTYCEFQINDAFGNIINNQPGNIHNSFLYSFLTPGTYTINFYNFSHTSTYNSQQLTVVVPPPATYTFSSTSICKGDAVCFNYTSLPSFYNLNPANGSQSIAYGDGSYCINCGAGPTYCHSYATAGTYTFTTSYGFNYDHQGNGDPYTGQCGHEIDQEIIVNPNPISTYTVNTSPVCVGNQVSFQQTSPDPTVTYNWNFGDGTTLNTGTTASCTHTYTSGGTFTSSCTATNASGCTSTSQVNVIVVPSVPAPFAVTANPGTICVGSSSILSIVNPDPSIFYTWTGGSNATSITVSPSATSTYTVTASNVCGVTSEQATVNVVPVPTNTGFSENPNPICFGGQVCLNAFNPNIAGYTYIFTDGLGNTISSATGLNVCQTYNSAGTFFPTLTISNGVCNSNTIVSTLTIDAATVSVKSGLDACGQNYVFNATPSGCMPVNAIYTWTVNNGGIITTHIGNPVSLALNGAATSVSLTVTSVSGAVLTTASLPNFFATASSLITCCGQNTDCISTDAPCTTTAPWSGTKTFTGTTVNISNQAITIMPNTTVQIAAGQTVNFLNCTFLIYQGSKFQIDHLATKLNFDQCYLHGCKRMWEGILFGGTNAHNTSVRPIIRVHNTMIEDAYTAIKVVGAAQFGDYAEVDVSNSIFNKNMYGIKFTNNPDANFSTANMNILNVTYSAFTSHAFIFNPSAFFYGQAFYNYALANAPVAPLLPRVNTPYSAKGMQGIYVEGVAVGGFPGVYNSFGANINISQNNIYDDVVEGIAIRGLNMARFTSNTFKNNTSPINNGDYDNYYLTKPAGIYYSGAGFINGSTLTYAKNTVGPVGNAQAQKNTFTNCYYGVYASEKSFDVRFNNFTNCYNGIYLKNANVPNASNNAVNSLIYYNNFTNLKYTGISMLANQTINAELTGNTISYSNAGSQNFSSRAIDIQEPLNTNPAFYNVHNNSFNKTWQGIRAMNTNTAKIDDNTIVLHSSTSFAGVTVNNALYNVGIHVIGSHNPQVSVNNITGIGTPLSPYWWEQGIVAVDCGTGKYFCNNVTSTFAGITTGASCAGTKIYHNDLHSVELAHWLIFANVIGAQSNPDMTAFWGTLQPADNRYYNIGTWYSYTQNNTNGQNFAPFYLRGGTGATAPFALVNNGTGYDGVTDFSSTVGILTPPTGVKPYIGSCGIGGGNPGGRLMNLAQRIAADALYPQTAEPFRNTSRRQLLNNLILDSVGVTGDPAIDNFPSVTAIEPTGTFFNVDQQIVQAITNADSTKLAQAKAINQTVAPTHISEQTQKNFNELYLEYLKNGNTLDAVKQAQLKTIAMLCPYNEGTAVWQARSLLKSFDNTEYVNSCEFIVAPPINDDNSGDGARKASPNNQAEPSLVNLYPNPNSGNFTIEIPGMKGEVIAEVLSPLGSVVGIYTATFTEENHTIKVDGMIEGMYFVKLTVDGTILETKRVVVTK